MKRKPYWEIKRRRGYWWARLRAGNGRIVAVTETYTRKVAALRAIEVARRAR